MKKTTILIAYLCLIGNMSNIAEAQPSFVDLARTTASKQLSLIPEAPDVSAHAYVLMDSKTQKIIASKHLHKKINPASLTKLMTLSIAFDAINAEQIHNDDMVRISEHAWSSKGSKMFLRQGSMVKVADLINGVIVASGNDASVALAEHIAGSEKAFVSLMNQTAKALGMHDTHFANATGFPNRDLYSTPYDLALLSQSIQERFPAFYPLFKQKWIKHNRIKQPNRNRLLWRDPSIDGMKTGHTENAGYCLSASAKRHNMRLITVVLGSPSDASRFNDTQILLGYGFRFFRSSLIVSSKKPLTQLRLWQGETAQLPLGLEHDFYATIPASDLNKAKLKIHLPSQINAPIQAGQVLGDVELIVANTVLEKRPLIALETIEKGNLWKQMKDTCLRSFKHFWQSSHQETTIVIG